MKIAHTLGFGAALAMAVSASAARIPKGTPVTLAFDHAMSSKTARDGDRVMLHVVKDVWMNGKVVIRAGTAERAEIAAVHGRGKFGKNASIRLALNPVMDVNNRPVPLQPRSKGHAFKGSRTDHAALAAGAGLLVLGPIGLVGGLFIPGKEVHIKPGDKLETEVSRSARL